MSAAKVPVPVRPIDFDIARRVVDDFAAERQVPTQTLPVTATAGEGPAAPRANPIPARSPLRKFTVELPDYVIDAILARTIQSRPRCTVRFVVLDALRQAGFEVKAADLVMDGRRCDSP